jgi:hypothetical protein
VTPNVTITTGRAGDHAEMAAEGCGDEADDEGGVPPHQRMHATSKPGHTAGHGFST